MKKVKTIKEVIGAREFNQLVKLDPSIGVLGAVPWQNVVAGKTLTHVESVDSYFATAEGPEKEQQQGWRDIQKASWHLYLTYGPVRTAINRKADFVNGHDFFVYSLVPEIQEFIFDLMYSYRNKLYAAVNGWMVRMQTQSDLFILLAVDEEGKITVRVIEPDRIGEGDDDGIITHPGDVSTTLFYKYQIPGKDVEYIPDISMMFNQEMLKDALKLDEDFKKLYNDDIKEGAKPSEGKAKFSKLGGYRRFILHWKNLTGINEYKRDTASLSAVHQAVKLYWNALMWELDHKKAQATYAIVIKFTEDAAGRLAWQIWTKMTEQQKKDTGLLDPYTPGSKIFLIPGMTMEIKNPQLDKLAGSNEDLLNIAGSGLGTAMDLWKGDSKGASFASVKGSRSPMVFEAKSLQSKFGNFFLYEFMRACCFIGVQFGAMDEFYPLKYAVPTGGGSWTFVDMDGEPVRHIGCSFPTLSLIDDLQDSMNAYLGSKHAGAHSIGVSAETIARKIGVDSLPLERSRQAIEDELYGKPVTGVDAELAAEQAFTDKGVETGGTKKAPAKAAPKKAPKIAPKKAPKKSTK